MEITTNEVVTEREVKTVVKDVTTVDPASSLAAERLLGKS